jgi:hypothetical protein
MAFPSKIDYDGRRLVSSKVSWFKVVLVHGESMILTAGIISRKLVHTSEHFSITINGRRHHHGCRCAYSSMGSAGMAVTAMTTSRAMTLMTVRVVMARAATVMTTRAVRAKAVMARAATALTSSMAHPQYPH